MTAFELILLVTMGDLIQQGVTQEDMSIVGAMLAVGTLALWITVMSYASFRFDRLRPALEGIPVVVLRKGKPLDEVLRLERVTLDELSEGARSQGIDDLSQVELAVLEPDGKFSFLKPGGDEGPSSGDEKHKA
jgi:uncharacterized membrane protein YcaP (DUF421 family)